MLFRSCLFYCCFAFRALYKILGKLLSLPPLYRRLGVRDPYFGHLLPSLPTLPSLEMCCSDFNSSSRSNEKCSSFAEESSSSDGSLPPPSFTPFDRGSRGRVPDQPSGGEVGQRFYKIFESSRFDSEGSVSGSAGPVFYS